MVKPVVRKQILFSSILVLFASAPAFSDAPVASNSSDGSVTSILQSIGTGLGTAGNVLNQVGNSQQSVQSLVNYMAAIRGQQSLFNNNQSTINQINQKMAVALGTAQSCLAKATQDISKYPNNTIDPLTLKHIDVTCNNYMNVSDSVKSYLAKLLEAKIKIGCIDTLSSAEETISDSAKGAFSSLIEAANQSWSTQGDIIKQYKDMGDDLTTRYNDANTQLQGLNALKLQVMDAIDGAKGNTQVVANGATVSLDTGLASELTTVLSARNTVANQWQQGILKDAWSCFNSDNSQPCDSLGGTASPAACITQQVDNLAGNSVTQGVQNGVNAQRLQSIFSTQSGILLRGDKATNLDAENTNAFLSYSQSSFEALNSQMTTVLSNYKGFVGKNVQAGTLAAFFHAKMSSCYSNAVANFKASMASDGSTTLGSTPDAMNYKGMLNDIVNGNPNAAGEKQIVASSKKWLSVISDQMTSFTTSFNTNYNSTLPTFAANCAASDDAATNIDCLRKLSATLQSGIDGTNHSATLSNGSTYQTNLGITNLTVNTMTLSATGAPTTGSSTVQCKGFTDCLNMLKNARDYDVKQSAAYSTARDKFVVSANSTVKADLALVGTAFLPAGQIIGSTKDALNAQLKALGFSASLNPKTVTGVELGVDGTTKLVTLPTSMSAAIAGKGSIIELDTHTDVSDEMDKNTKEYGLKLNEAIKMKYSCTVLKADYTSILNSIGKVCSTTADVCQEHKLQAALGYTESVLNKSQIKGSLTDSQSGSDGSGNDGSSGQSSVDTINSTFKDCMTQTRTGATVSQAEMTFCTDSTDRGPDRTDCIIEAQKRAANLAGSPESCIQDFADDLKSLDDRARNPELKKTNGELIDDIVSLETACQAENAFSIQTSKAALTAKGVSRAQTSRDTAQKAAADADAKAKATPSDKSLLDAAATADKALLDANTKLESISQSTDQSTAGTDPAGDVTQKCNDLKKALNADIKNASDKVDDGSGTDSANSIDGGTFSNPQKSAQ